MGKFSKYLKTLLIITTSLLLLLLGQTNQADEVKTVLDESDTKVPAKSVKPGYYFVSEVYDGDTIGVVMNGEVKKVRLIGVDTPEKNHPEKPVQCFSLRASEYTKKKVLGTGVRLVSDGLSSNRDRYNRLLRYVYLENGQLLNAEIIKNGFGFSYLLFDFQKAKEFYDLEQAARANSRGLWNGCSIVNKGETLETAY